MSLPAHHAEQYKMLREEIIAALAPCFRGNKYVPPGNKRRRLAHIRTSDERKIADVVGLLQHWMIFGKPHREAKQKGLANKTVDS